MQTTITMTAHHNVAYAACAIYEHLYTTGADDWPKWLRDMHNDIGAPAFRDFVITELADYVNAAWFFSDALKYGGSFDYDFVPDLFDLMKGWEHFHKAPSRELGVQLAERWHKSAEYMREIPF